MNSSFCNAVPCELITGTKWSDTETDDSVSTQTTEKHTNETSLAHFKNGETGKFKLNPETVTLYLMYSSSLFRSLLCLLLLSLLFLKH